MTVRSVVLSTVTNPAYLPKCQQRQERRHSRKEAQEGLSHPAVLLTNAYKCTGTSGEGRATCRGGGRLNL